LPSFARWIEFPTTTPALDESIRLSYASAVVAADMPNTPLANVAQPNLAHTFAEAIKLHQHGRLSEAERLYAAILAAKPDHVDALHFLGLIKFANGQPIEALRLIATAMRSGTRSPEIFLNHGILLNALNRHEEAIESFDRAVRLEPRYFEAHNSRGVVLAVLGRNEEALKSFRKALAIKPNSAEALYNLGNSLKALGRIDEALASFDRALAVRPDYAEVFCNRGTILQELKKPDQALASYDRALALRPDIAEAHFNRGNALNEMKRYDEALASFDRAIALRPDYAKAHCNRGNVLNDLKRYGEALASLDRALTLSPDYHEALCSRGISLQGMRKLDEALASYDRAVALRPDIADLHSNRGTALNDLKRYDEALASFDLALSLQPDHVEALANRGAVLQELKRFDEALASCDRALALAPDHATALCNRGAALQEFKRYDEALAVFAHALSVQPDMPKLHWNEAAVRLVTGDFARGWAEYEWRWKKETMARAMRNFLQPLWLGKDEIAGKTILLHSEQGFGDTIQFCRYATLVAARGARVILEVERPLHTLMATLAGPAQVVSKGGPLPDFDLQCPLLSLPLACGTQLSTIPAQTPYLQVPAQASRIWESRLGAKPHPKIGLVWSGNAAHQRDIDRSISLHMFLPLLESDATFISLQKEVRASDAAVMAQRPDVLHFGDMLGDFSDTAALITQLDLVITVDTSAAHLAAALGKPVWILLQHTPDWRWLLDREDSPWYPTARLFRQDETRTWDSAIARVQTALAKLVDGNAASEP
jgi:tetratricopeptide (TPR) repeat protein